MMSMSRILRYTVGLAVVLAISAQVAQAAAPDHELVLGSAVRQPKTVVRVVHTGGGNGFDWTAALVGAGSAVGIMVLAGGAAAGVRSRRRVAIS